MIATTPTIFYICTDFERALGLEKILPNLHIVCIDFNEGILAVRAQGGHVFSLQELTGPVGPTEHNSNYLLQHMLVQKYIAQHTPANTIPNVMFFKIAENLEETCKALGYNYLNTTSELNQLFENKLSQYELLQKAGVHMPAARIGKLKEFNVDQIINDFNLPFVLQYGRGHTGSSTLFIPSAKDFFTEVTKYPERKAKICQYIQGDSWTINACVTRNGIAGGGLSYQITGIPECTSKKGGTVGNDWNLVNQLSSKTIQEIKNLTLEVGQIMQQHGFKGLFGLDLIIDNGGTVWLIEINARQPASTGMHTKLMLAQKHIPLELLHIAEFLYTENESYIEFINSVLNTAFSLEELPTIIQEQNHKELASQPASQVILRNTAPETVLSNIQITTGIYMFTEGKLQKVRPGYSIEDLANTEEFLVIASDKTLHILPEGELARVQAKRSSLTTAKNGTVPDPKVINIITAIKHAQ